MKQNFLPISLKEAKARGWSELDIIIITGDAYVDHPSFGAAVIGRVLEAHGYRVGIIAQPDWKSCHDFQQLGRPRLFFGITSGNVDSMIANYTANKRKRRMDDCSPGGKADLRPDRALIVYANRVREAYAGVNVVLGGMEASLRRFAHYDYWAEQVRRSILFDTKTDLLVYGMGEGAILEIADRLAGGEALSELNHIRGTAVLRKDIDFLDKPVMLPSFESVKESKQSFALAFKASYEQMSPKNAHSLVQQHGSRYLVQFPPRQLSQGELDKVYELPYQRAWHPVYDKQGGVKGLETVRTSLISHRGCCGECSFCSLFLHQGRIVQSRSEQSIVREARALAQRDDFKGTITDVGGPTANLYQANCSFWDKGGYCREKKCLAPTKCDQLKLGYQKSLSLYRKLRELPKVKHVFIGSGFRYDLLVDNYAAQYLEEVCNYHVSGQLKVAPEHVSDHVLKVMNKTPFALYQKFVKRFNQVRQKLGKKIFLVNYFLSAHPGSTLEDAQLLADYLQKCHIRPQQVQDFTPSPLSLATCIYYTGIDPFSGEKVFVPKTFKERQMQRALIQPQNKVNHKLIKEARKILRPKGHR